MMREWGRGHGCGGGSWPGYGPPFCQGLGASPGGGPLAAAADGKGVRGTGRIRRLSRAGAGGDGAPGGRGAFGGPDCWERSVGREQSGGTEARVGLGAVAGPPEDREPAFSRQGYGPAWAGGGNRRLRNARYWGAIRSSGAAKPGRRERWWPPDAAAPKNR